MTSNFYRMKNNIPLLEEGHAFIETNPPERKNRDYKARPRNYTFGFPIYKKDAYTRHWGNLMIVVNDKEHAPKYVKIGAWFYFAGCIMSSLFKSVSKNLNQLHINSENLHLTDYTRLQPMKMIKLLFKENSKIGLSVAAFFLSFSLISDYIKSKNYSTSQAYLRSSFIVVPAAYLMYLDQPVNRFLLHSGFLSITFFLLIFTFHNYKIHHGQSVAKHKEGDFIYLKGVTNEEREAIEFQDKNLLKADKFRQLDKDQKYNF